MKSLHSFIATCFIITGSVPRLFPFSVVVQSCLSVHFIPFTVCFNPRCSYQPRITRGGMRERGAVSCCGVWDGVGQPLLSLCSLSVLCVCRVSCSVLFSLTPSLCLLSRSLLSRCVHCRAWCCYVYTNQYLRRLMMYVICAYRLVSIE